METKGGYQFETSEINILIVCSNNVKIKQLEGFKTYYDFPKTASGSNITVTILLENELFVSEISLCPVVKSKFIETTTSNKGLTSACPEVNNCYGLRFTTDRARLPFDIPSIYPEFKYYIQSETEEGSVI